MGDTLSLGTLSNEIFNESNITKSYTDPTSTIYISIGFVILAVIANIGILCVFLADFAYWNRCYFLLIVLSILSITNCIIMLDKKVNILVKKIYFTTRKCFDSSQYSFFFTNNQKFIQLSIAVDRLLAVTCQKFYKKMNSKYYVLIILLLSIVFSITLTCLELTYSNHNDLTNVSFIPYIFRNKGKLLWMTCNSVISFFIIIISTTTYLSIKIYLKDYTFHKNTRSGMKIRRVTLCLVFNIFLHTLTTLIFGIGFLLSYLAITKYCLDDMYLKKLTWLYIIDITLYLPIPMWRTTDAQSTTNILTVCFYRRNVFKQRNNKIEPFNNKMII
uniref:G_PROTEIN_RECEP_F1_2 domain-containing protein n=1 Tax=Strongyloides venezuelensis TaxID=75913 RepID=A0A0K0F1C0_STRVS